MTGAYNTVNRCSSAPTYYRCFGSPRQNKTPQRLPDQHSESRSGSLQGHNRTIVPATTPSIVLMLNKPPKSKHIARPHTPDPSNIAMEIPHSKDLVTKATWNKLHCFDHHTLHADCVAVMLTITTQNTHTKLQTAPTYLMTTWRPFWSRGAIHAILPCHDQRGLLEGLWFWLDDRGNGLATLAKEITHSWQTFIWTQLVYAVVVDLGVFACWILFVCTCV